MHHKVVPRSRHGCVVCIHRRKKCDEARPVCGACQRLNLDCRWKDGGKAGVEKKVAQVATSNPDLRLGHRGEIPIHLVARLKRPLMQTPAVSGSNGYISFRDQVQFDLVLQAPRLLNFLISRTASDDFRETNVLVTLALRNEWMRDALAAFSAYNIAASDQVLPPQADSTELAGLNMYQHAVAQLRQHLTSASHSAQSIETLTCITFLGIFESLGTGNARLAITHFAASLYLSQKLALPPPSRPVELRLYRIAVECWLFNLATLTICHPLPDNLVSSIDWDMLDQAFGKPFSAHKLAIATSPFLGGGQVIYKLMLNATWFARQDLTPETRLAQTERWSHELELIEDDLHTYLDVLPRNHALLYYWKALLHILALRIYLVKIADHSMSSTSPAIMELVKAARGVLEKTTTLESRNPSMAWPLIVFLCASQAADNLDFFVGIMSAIRDNFDPGHRRRLSAILQILANYDQTGRTWMCQDDCSHSHDTLDLLLAHDGILGV